MRILIVNDDGIDSPKLETLVRVASRYGLIYVCAPLEHQSAKSHAISIKPKIKIDFSKHIANSKQTIGIDGYPADTVRLGFKIFQVEFDLVLSGINEGYNIAADVNYSGTIAAAREAVILGTPGIAISTAVGYDEYLDDKLINLFDVIFKNKLYEKYPLLNINIPDDEKISGIKYTTVGRRLHYAEFNKIGDSDEYTINYSKMIYGEEVTADALAIDKGYISITPLTIDQTDYEALKELHTK